MLCYVNLKVASERDAQVADYHQLGASNKPIRLSFPRIHSEGPFRETFRRLILGWLLVGLAGKPDYPQKLKVPEGYEKMIDYSNI